MRVLFNTVFYTLVAVVVGVCLFTFSGFGGIKPVKSGSMSPTFNRGDVVITRAVPASTIRVGQIIDFTPCKNAPGELAHRVYSEVQKNGKLVIETKGDANGTVDPWQCVISGRGQIVLGHIPEVGNLWFWAAEPKVKGTVFFGGLGVVLLGALYFLLRHPTAKPQEVVEEAEVEEAPVGRHFKSAVSG